MNLFFIGLNGPGLKKLNLKKNNRNLNSVVKGISGQYMQKQIYAKGCSDKNLSIHRFCQRKRKEGLCRKKTLIKLNFLNIIY